MAAEQGSGAAARFAYLVGSEAIPESSTPTPTQSKQPQASSRQVSPSVFSKQEITPPIRTVSQPVVAEAAKVSSRRPWPLLRTLPLFC